MNEEMKKFFSNLNEKKMIVVLGSRTMYQRLKHNAS